MNVGYVDLIIITYNLNPLDNQVGLRGAPSSSSSSSVVSFSSVVAAATAAESNAIPETEDSSKTLAEVSSQKYGSKRTSRSSTSGDVIVFRITRDSNSQASQSL